MPGQTFMNAFKHHWLQFVEQAGTKLGFELDELFKTVFLVQFVSTTGDEFL